MYRLFDCSFDCLLDCLNAGTYVLHADDVYGIGEISNRGIKGSMTKHYVYEMNHLGIRTLFIYVISAGINNCQMSGNISSSVVVI